MLGGKLVDTGGYSCIFYPSLRCKSSTIKPQGRMISKLMKKEEATHEYDISQKIRQIPLWQNYFSVAESICRMNSKQTDRDVKYKCELTKENPLRELRLLQLSYAGKSITNYSLPREFNLLQFITHILEAGALLLQHGIIHFDIHAGNILLDTHQVPRIIDFNLSKDVDNVIEEETIYEYSSNLEISQQTPDTTVMAGLLQGKDVDVIVHDISQKQMISQIQQILTISRATITSDITSLLNDNLISNGDLVGWFRTYWTKIDSWGIGTYLVKIIKSRLAIPQFYATMKENWSTIKKVLLKLCAIHPAKRWDCMQALYALNPNSVIIRKYGKAWLDTHGYP